MLAGFELFTRSGTALPEETVEYVRRRDTFTSCIIETMLGFCKMDVTLLCSALSGTMGIDPSRNALTLG